jgi:hypothetical protein
MAKRLRLRPIPGIVWLALCMLSACGKPSTGGLEAGENKPASQDNLKQQTPLAAPVPAQPIKSETRKIEPQAIPTTRRAKSEAEKDKAPEQIVWGLEISLDKIVAMAKDGRIREIQWHVMPNVLRIETTDGAIFHLKNENKGVDLRNTLIKAGIQIGKGGITFRHVF